MGSQIPTVDEFFRECIENFKTNPNRVNSAQTLAKTYGFRLNDIKSYIFVVLATKYVVDQTAIDAGQSVPEP